MNNDSQRSVVSKKTLYTAKTHTTGGREGNVKSNDGRLDILLAPPGTNKTGTNPEQLFAAGWSACYIGALGLAAKKMGMVLPRETFIDAEIDLCMSDDAYFLEARLQVNLPDIEKDLARELVGLAHQICPYSKAINRNINVITEIL